MKRKISPATARREAAIDAPKQLGEFSLHPLTFGLVEWLTTRRKNPVVTGGPVAIKNVLELCFAFTLPSFDLCRMSDAKVAEGILEFSHRADAAVFHVIERHAQREFAKFSATVTTPKSPAAPAPPKKTSRKK